MKDEVKLELKNLLSRPQGRAFLAWLIFDVCGVLRTTYAQDPRTSAFQEGARNIGLRLHAELESVDPTKLMQMYGEFAHARRDQQHHRDDGG